MTISVSGNIKVPSGGFVVKPPPAVGDANFADVSLLAHMDSASFVDSSSNGHTATLANSPVFDSSIKKFGAGSFDSDLIPNDVELHYGTSSTFDITGDFTLETWIRLPQSTIDSGFYYILTYASDPSDRWIWFLNNGNGMRLLVGGTAGSFVFDETDNSKYIADTWQHIALTRSNNDWRFFVDGVVNGTTTDSASISSLAGAELHVGTHNSGVASNRMEGHFDDVRITKGVARYTANFDVPTEAFPDS